MIGQPRWKALLTQKETTKSFQIDKLWLNRRFLNGGIWYDDCSNNYGSLKMMEEKG
jgi:hypothetical protein